MRGFLRTFADVVVQAPTGSGKTLAYVLPIVEMILKQKQLVANKHNVRLCGAYNIPLARKCR